MTSIDSARPPRAPATDEHDYADLARTIRESGLLHRRYGYYLAKISLNVVAFAGGWVAFAFLGDTWWQLLLAAFFAVMFAQLSFIGHDAGHRQILRSGRANDVIGRLHGGLVGLSYAGWIGQHTRHHAHPNHEEHDPDIQIPALAFTREQGAGKRGFLRWLAKYQAFLFFPLLLLEGISLHVAAVQTMRRRDLRARRIEIALLLGHFVAYFTAVFLVLSPLTAIVFILVHQALWGVYMGCSFAPGHKGMPIMPAGQPVDFLRRQVLTTRNVRGGVAVDFVLGGLNYQIEHHLFPTMPRPNLRRAQPLVRAFCAQRGIEYAQCGWLRTYGYVLQHLHAVGAPLRAGAR